MIITIDPTVLGSHFDPKEAEERGGRRWLELGVHRFDEDAAAPTYVIDTPPPNVSADRSTWGTCSPTRTPT